MKHEAMSLGVMVCRPDVIAPRSALAPPRALSTHEGLEFGEHVFDRVAFWRVRRREHDQVTRLVQQLEQRAVLVDVQVVPKDEPVGLQALQQFLGDEGAPALSIESLGKDPAAHPSFPDCTQCASS